MIPIIKCHWKGTLGPHGRILRHRKVSPGLGKGPGEKYNIVRENWIMVKQRWILKKDLCDDKKKSEDEEDGDKGEESKNSSGESQEERTPLSASC